MTANAKCTFCENQQKIMVDSKYIVADLIPGYRLFDESSLKRYKDFEKKDLIVCEECIHVEQRSDKKRKIQFLILVVLLTTILFLLGFIVPLSWNGMLLVMIVGGIFAVTGLLKKIDLNDLDDLLRLFNKRLAEKLGKKEALVRFWTINRFEKLNQDFPVDVKD